MTVVELLPFAAVAAVFWLLILRPARARRQAQERLQASLAPGQRIMTTAGLFGTIRTVDERRLDLEVAPGVVVTMVPQAVARIESDAAPAEDPPAVRSPEGEDGHRG